MMLNAQCIMHNDDDEKVIYLIIYTGPADVDS